MIPELQIMICRQCKHAVYLIEVQTHLRKKHCMTILQIQPVVAVVQQWTDLIQDPDAVHILQELENPLPIIPLHTNGMQCQRDPNHCHYISTHVKKMRQHWQQAHRWSQQTHSRQVHAVQQRQGKEEFEQLYQIVAWQQVFPTCKNSHLVHI